MLTVGLFSSFLAFFILLLLFGYHYKNYFFVIVASLVSLMIGLSLFNGGVTMNANNASIVFVNSSLSTITETPTYVTMNIGFSYLYVAWFFIMLFLFFFIMAIIGLFEKDPGV